MRFIRLILSVGLLGGLLYILNDSIPLGSTNAPPLGHFLNPFQGYLQNGEGETLPFNESIINSELQEEVSVLFDSLTVPHIFAQNDNDLYFTQGYVVAQERLWQMEFQTFAAAGRLSEILGVSEGYQDFDRYQRRIGMLESAKQNLEVLKKEGRAWENTLSYTAGVNAYIEQLSYKDLPIEYKILNYSPEKWTPLKTGLLLMYMVNNLTSYDRDLENTKALAMLGREDFDLLYPEFTPGIDPVVPTQGPYDFEALSTQPDSIPLSLPELEKFRQTNPDNGSNNWAVSGEKTKNGKPLLAGDTHLGLNLPSLWMVMHLHTPETNVAGYTFTGNPGIVIGFNEKISWSFTNAPRDGRDWYKIQYKDESRKEYLYAGNWEKVIYRYDTIKIRDAEPLIDTIAMTQLGPVVYDNAFRSSSPELGLALKWIGHYPNRILSAILGINRASDYATFQKAMVKWDAPPQNAAFAAVDGDIALRIEGTFPLKWKEQGKFIMDGSRKDHDWNSFIPHEHNAFLHNPERNYISSANQHSVDSMYPYYVYNGSNEMYRNLRINELLSKNEEITPQFFMNMHYDAVNIKAREMLPHFLSALDSTFLASRTDEEREVLEILSAWNYDYQPEEVAPTYFRAWWRSFSRLLWDEMLANNLPLPNTFHTTWLMKNVSELSYTDVLETAKKETWEDVVQMSFLQSQDMLKDWQSTYGSLKWADINRIHLRHLLRLPAFTPDTVRAPGSGDVINAANGNHGPSQRLIVEMTEPPKAYFVYPGGQSGNPGSKRFTNFLPLWAEGKYLDFYFPLEKPEDFNGFTQTFNNK